MRGLNLKEIMSKSNMNQQGLNIATYGQAYPREKLRRSCLRPAADKTKLPVACEKLNLW